MLRLCVRIRCIDPDMKLSLALIFLPLAVLQAGRPPNVVFIVTDDLGYADLGAQGLRADVKTPHLDRLVREGVLFTEGYVTAPQCAPSRAG